MPVSKIKTNKVSNLKALASFEANFNGCTAIVTGANNSGKSSFLKSLPERLNNIKPDIILKNGESEGFQEIELTTGEKFIWSFDNKTAKGERLIFITLDQHGSEIKTSITQEIAKRFFPPMFDIDEFLHSAPKKQKKILEETSGLDFTLINERYKVAYDDRTLANSKLKDAKANLKPINEKLPVKPIDTTFINNEIYNVDHHNLAYKNAEELKSQCERDLEGQDKEIKRLEQLLKDAKAKKGELEGRIKKGKEWLDTEKNKPYTDDELFDLNKKLQEALDTNKLISINNEAIRQKEAIGDLELKAKDADNAVKKIEKEKLEMIQGSNLPEGFDFTEDGILYNGLPVTKEQLSSSGIYIAALKLSAPLLGEVKTLFFDASYLDKNSLKEIEDWAKKEGTHLFGEPIQLLIERPDFDAGEIRYELISETK